MEQIDYFLSVAEKKSMSAAARSLYISQPALSKQMSLLEEEIGVKLFFRESRGVRLTKAGIQFADDLKKIRSELEDAKLRAAAVGKSQKKVVHIGCFEGDSIDDFFPVLYRYLSGRDEKIQPVLHRIPFSVSARDLEQDRLDFVILFGADRLNKKGYREKTIFRREGVLIYSENSPLGQKEKPEMVDFADQIFLTTRERQGNDLTGHDIDVLRAHGILLPQVEVLENFMTLMTYLSMGYGYCILSKDAVSLHSGLRYYEPDPPIDMDILAVWKESNTDITELMEDYVCIL